MKNPFKFGTIVDEPYFINRKKEIAKVLSLLGSENHLVVISPRRFGKSSLIFKTVKMVNRPVIAVDMQLVTSPDRPRCTNTEAYIPSLSDRKTKATPEKIQDHPDTVT